MNRLTTTDLWTLLAVAALTGIAAMLAMAETGLTRMSRARAMHLAEDERRGADLSIHKIGANPEEDVRMGRV